MSGAISAASACAARQHASRNAPLAGFRLAVAPGSDHVPARQGVASRRWVMSKPVPVYGGSSRPCSPAWVLLSAARRLAASRMAPPVHGVSTARATTPKPPSAPAGRPGRRSGAPGSVTDALNMKSAHMAARHHLSGPSLCPCVQRRTLPADAVVSAGPMARSTGAAPIAPLWLTVLLR